MAKEEFLGSGDYQHGTKPALGILLLNLGTPEAPDRKSLKTYLREFLSDRRVIEVPKWKWWLVLNAIVLNTRPQKSAEAYKEVWTEDGSPLLSIGKKQAAKIQTLVNETFKGDVHVALGMRYGNPSVASAMRELKDKQCERILVLPLYPQYCAATTGSCIDAVAKEIQTWRWIPEIRFVNNYFEEESWVQAMANSIRDYWKEHGKAQRLQFSFHGTPKSYLCKGAPYHCLCHKSARLIAEKLGLSAEEYSVSFQSRFGPEEWLKPYTDETIKSLPEKGIKDLQVVCPGFSADCLETIEEIDGENREYFEHAGGEKFGYIPCLNDRDDHMTALMEVIKRHTQGWMETASDYDAMAHAKALEDSKARAKAMGCPV